MSRILVTGAAGLLGRFVVRELLAHGYAVRGFDRRAGDADIEWRVADVTDAAAVGAAMEGIDAVLHIAALPNIWSGDGATIMHVNTQGTWLVFEAAEARGIGRVVPMQRGEFDSFYLSAKVTLSPEPTLDRLRRLHGDAVEIRDPDYYRRNPVAPLYDLSHAATRLGFVPEYDQRHLLAGLPGFEN